MLTDGLVALVNANAAIAAIAGNRIAPPPAPEDLSNYPCVTYGWASYETDETTDGPTDFSQAHIVFQCFAIRKADANALANAIRKMFSGYAGTLPDGTIVDSVRISNMDDSFDPGSRVSTFTVHISVNYSEQ